VERIERGTMTPGKLYKLVPRKMSVYSVPAQGANEWEVLYISVGSIGLFLEKDKRHYKFLIGERVVTMVPQTEQLVGWEEFNEDSG
jgi:hypothetical protein